MSEALPSELAKRWRTALVLKQDVFSTVERGSFAGSTGEVEAVLRRLDLVPWWSLLLARHLFTRECRALTRAGDLGVAPRLLFADRKFLVRSFIDGTALHLARPTGDVAYFRSARSALRRLHRSGITHNDLAKEQNWLRGADGNAYLTDFQLAMVFRHRSKLFRIAAYEDLRHFLKHKRSYVPSALTSAEKRVLARKSLPTRIWMATGKRVYRLVTRGIFGFIDREGGGPRLVNDAPAIVSTLKASVHVRDAAVVAFPDRRAGTGLYAFVETPEIGMETELLKAIASQRIPAPERLQLVAALPRDAAGNVRLEILQLVAMNQVDLVDQLIKSEAEREIVAGIVSGRQNLRDRFSF